MKTIFSRVEITLYKYKVNKIPELFLSKRQCRIYVSHAGIGQVQAAEIIPPANGRGETLAGTFCQFKLQSTGTPMLPRALANADRIRSSLFY